MARKRQLVTKRKVHKPTRKKTIVRPTTKVRDGSTSSINGRPTFYQEVVAIFGIFVSLFVYLSLFAHIFIPNKNWSGQFGTTIAKGLFDFIGWGAYAFPTLGLAASILFFRSQLSLLRLPHVMVGLSGAIIGFCGMLSAFALRDPSMIVAGGFVGRALFTIFDAVVGHGGAMMIFFFIFLISLMVALQFSPYLLVTNIGYGLCKLRDLGVYLLAKFKEWRETFTFELPEIEYEEEEYEEDDYEQHENNGKKSLLGRLFSWRKRSENQYGVEDDGLDDEDIFPSTPPKTPFFTGRRGCKKEENTCNDNRAETVLEEVENESKENKAQVYKKEVQETLQDGRPVLKAQAKAVKEVEEDGQFSTVPLARGDWKLPPLSLLTRPADEEEEVDKDVYYRVSQLLEQKLANFGVKGKVIGISPGPVVTTYEYAPAPGVKINKIVGLADDLKLGLKVKSVRVAGAVPGKAALGIEIPNKKRQIVHIRRLIGSEEYRSLSAKLSMVLGLDVAGSLSTANLAKMPHLLIAGATGAGKSVGINTIIASILYNATPEEVRFLMVDPKRIELSGYEGIPHLLHPVVVEPKLASRALNWAVREMERRYRMLEEARVKSFDSYNKQAEEKLPYIVIIVDELADLMMVASKDVEAAIARLAQMARAAGMHVILATQRPSVDVLTGLIKANFPTRISFKVSSKIDSRTILDTGGAEHLLGMGDMLYLPNGGSIKRVHGAYISEKETADIVDFWKEQGSSSYDPAMIEELEKEEPATGEEAGGDYDEFYDQAVAFVTEQGQASISSVQRRLRVGYNRAANMIERMERDGIVGPANGAKPREVIVRQDYSNI